MKTTKCILTLYVAVLSLCSIAKSAVSNGGFETGDLSGWNYSGTVGSVTNEYAREFLGLVQPPSGGIWYPSEGNYFASLWSTDSVGTDVSSLSQSFYAEAGDILQFDYFFDFGDYSPYYDWATGTLSWTGNSITLFEINTLGHELNDDENVDWTSIMYSLPISDTYTLGFTIADGAVPGSYESILGIDNVEVIPAPGALLLVGIGVGIVHRMRRQKIL